MVKKFEKVKDELLEHEYDGIQELDNELPPWWLWLFYITIIWSVIYLIHFHVLGTGASQDEEYQQEMIAAQAMYQRPAGGTTTSTLLADENEKISPLTDDQSLAEGKIVYDKNCIPCHGKNGEGGVGPNMTDEYWIHGATMNDMVRTIINGVPAKGMIPWGPVLKEDEILKVASFLKTFRGTNPPNAKAPEGEKIDYSLLEE